MVARLGTLWVTVRDSLWFLPGVLTLLACALALGITEIERNEYFEAVIATQWIFRGGAEGARGVLTAIAGGLITVTGVVFSVMIVALQLASSQFTPRVLRNFTADRGNQLVLGVFIATFTYTLLVLRTVQASGQEEEPFIPRLGVTIGVVLVLVSIGFLIFFINHSARSIQVATILDRVTRRTLRDVYRLFPEQVGRAGEILPSTPMPSEWDSVSVPAGEAGYLQAVDSTNLFQLGQAEHLVIAMEPYIGDFVLEGQMLARLSPRQVVDARVIERVRNAFLLGAERSPEQDVEYGIVEISDIALRALSPGINDPTTACQCIDRLAEILLALGTRSPPDAERTAEGHVHFVARHTTLERAAGLAFDQIRHFGASNPTIVAKLLSSVTALVDLLPSSRRGPLLKQRAALHHAAQLEIEKPLDIGGVGTAERMST
jgi:uncharacterized membrane protein